MINLDSIIYRLRVAKQAYIYLKILDKKYLQKYYKFLYLRALFDIGGNNVL